MALKIKLRRLRCSFCEDGLRGIEVAGGPKVHICDTCVEATRTVLQTQIDVLRNRAISWSAIGEVLGMSRQAAWERSPKLPASPVMQ